MTEQNSEISEQPVQEETEKGPYSALRESLTHLGEVEPGLICQTTQRSKPLAMVVPSTDKETHDDSYDTIVAVSDDEIHSISILPRHYAGNDGKRFVTTNEPASDLFRPNKKGRFLTYETIKAKLSFGGTGSGALWNDRVDSNKGGVVLLESLYARNEANMQNQTGNQGELTSSQTERFATLRVAFDPATFDPNEDLAARFNALAQKLEAASTTG